MDRPSVEEKSWWVVEWRKAEEEFVLKVAPALGLNAEINPEKEMNPYAPDLIVNGALADLKCQRSPFFRARDLYDFDSRYTVTFNRKDYLRYQEHYPALVLYFWVRWEEREMTIGGFRYEVEPLRGVWRTSFDRVAALIETGRAPLHTYRNRVDDSNGNAKDSYLLDVRSLDCLGSRLQ